MGMNYIPLRTYQLVSWISSINREWIRSLAFLGCFTRLFSCFGSGTPGHYVETSWKKRKVPCSVVSRAHTNSCPFFLLEVTTKIFQIFWSIGVWVVFYLPFVFLHLCFGGFPQNFSKNPQSQKTWMPRNSGNLFLPGMCRKWNKYFAQELEGTEDARVGMLEGFAGRDQGGPCFSKIRRVRIG